MAAPVRADGSQGHPEQLLLTVQHAIRSQANPTTGTYNGPYWTDYRAWPAGSHYFNKDSHTLEPHPVLVPDVAAPFSHATDLAFLRFPTGQTGHHAASLLRDEDCQKGTKGITVLGYDAGEELLYANEDEVIPGPHPGWQYLNYLEKKGAGTLAGGGTQPQPGASGGAVMREGRLAGLYRGAFPDIGQHVFMPLSRIRVWVSARKWELVDTPSAPRPWIVEVLAVIAIGLAGGVTASLSLGPYFTYAPWLWVPCLLLAAGIAALTGWKHRSRSNTAPPPTPRQRTTRALILGAVTFLAALGIAIPIASSFKVVVTGGHTSELKRIRYSLNPEAHNKYKASYLAPLELHKSISGPMVIFPKGQLTRYHLMDARFKDGVSFRPSLLTLEPLPPGPLRFHSHFVLVPPPPLPSAPP
jgi:hypothetical protein